MNDAIFKLTNALDLETHPQVRLAMNEAMTAIKQAEKEIRHLKNRMGEMNAKHHAISKALKNCERLISG